MATCIVYPDKISVQNNVENTTINEENFDTISCPVCFCLIKEDVNETKYFGHFNETTNKVQHICHLEGACKSYHVKENMCPSCKISLNVTNITTKTERLKSLYNNLNSKVITKNLFF